MKYNHYPKRDAIKNYFPLPNEIFSLGLSSGEISINRQYTNLSQCAFAQREILRQISIAPENFQHIDFLMSNKKLTFHRLPLRSFLGSMYVRSS